MGSILNCPVCLQGMDHFTEPIRTGIWSSPKCCIGIETIICIHNMNMFIFSAEYNYFSSIFISKVTNILLIICTFLWDAYIYSVIFSDLNKYFKIPRWKAYRSRNFTIRFSYLERNSASFLIKTNVNIQCLNPVWFSGVFVVFVFWNVFLWWQYLFILFPELKLFSTESSPGSYTAKLQMIPQIANQCKVWWTDRQTYKQNFMFLVVFVSKDSPTKTNQEYLLNKTYVK